MKKVFIDAGHGGKDSGATGNGIKEKDIVLSVSLKIGEVLKRHNVEVFYSRETDVFIELTERATMANQLDVDVFVSVHANAMDNDIVQGLETFSHPNSKNGTALAKCIQDSLIKDKLYTKNRGIKTANFSVLRNTKMTAALGELGFITNKEDSDILKNKQNELAESIAKGILNFLGMKYIEDKEEKSTTSSNTLYKVQVGSYSVKENAEKLLADLKKFGFTGFITETEPKEEDDIKSKYYKIGDTHIIETTPDNIEIKILGDTLDKSVGVNGVLFDTQTAPVTSPDSCVFIAMNDGNPLSDNSQFNGYKGPPRATLIYHTNKQLGFRQLKDINSIRNNTIWAVGGFMVKPYMDFKNEQIPGSVNYKTAHTYIGYDAEGRVYLIVKPNHNISEIVPLLDQLRITNCIVLDGGGSSQLNHPQGSYKSSRKINSAILLKQI